MVVCHMVVSTRAMCGNCSTSCSFTFFNVLDHASYNTQKKRFILRKKRSKCIDNVKVPLVRFDDPRFFQRELLAVVELPVSDASLRTVAGDNG